MLYIHTYIQMKLHVPIPRGRLVQIECKIGPIFNKRPKEKMDQFLAKSQKAKLDQFSAGGQKERKMSDKETAAQGCSRGHVWPSIAIKA